MEVARIPVGSLETNCYIASSGGKCVVLDPGGDAEEILRRVLAKGLEVEAILLTHGHFDHFLAAGRVQESTGAPVFVGEDDMPYLKDPGWMRQFIPSKLALPEDVRPLREGDSVPVGKESLSVMHTPGHSPGSCCFRAPGVLFAGDLVFCRGVGRTDLPGGDPDILRRSIQRVMALPGSTSVYPGHGPATSVDDEKSGNTYSLASVSIRQRRRKNAGFMEGKAMLKSPRGTFDVLPPDSAKWIYLEGVVREVARRYNFEEIRLPTFEHAELYSRTVGEATDIVEKEMYAFKDKTGRDLTLRPEGTAGVARAFLEHGMAGGPLPRKLYYLGSMFRYEKPQAGRYREHRQFGVEVFGSPSPLSDVEVITLAMDISAELGLEGTELVLNSIGCPKCRAAYREKLLEYFLPRRDHLCDDCRSRLARNPLRVLDCKTATCKAHVAGAPGSLEFLCDECKEHWDQLRAVLTSQGIMHTVDKALVRGLDYYTRTVFELKWPPLGAGGNTVCGGGRYDGLIEDLGGPPTPGVGFGMGLERMLLAAEKGSRPIKAGGEIDVFVVAPKAEGMGGDRVLDLARVLRKSGLSCDFDPVRRSMKAQMKQADRMGARFVAILGEDEVKSGSVAIRSMKEGWQKTIGMGEVVSFVEEAVKRV